jgi:hypothetical protein
MGNIAPFVCLSWIKRENHFHSMCALFYFIYLENILKEIKGNLVGKNTRQQVACVLSFHSIMQGKKMCEKVEI